MVLAEGEEEGVVIQAVHGEADGHIRGAAIASGKPQVTSTPSKKILQPWKCPNPSWTLA